MRKVLILVMTVLALAAATGCNWMGNTAGRAVGSVENAGAETKSGYEEGYKQNAPDN